MHGQWDNWAKQWKRPCKGCSGTTCARCDVNFPEEIGATKRKFLKKTRKAARLFMSRQDSLADKAREKGEMAAELAFKLPCVGCGGKQIRGRSNELVWYSKSDRVQ